MSARREPIWSTNPLVRWAIYLPLMVVVALVVLGILDALNGSRALLEGWSGAEAMLLVAGLAAAGSAAWVTLRRCMGSARPGTTEAGRRPDP